MAPPEGPVGGGERVTSPYCVQKETKNSRREQIEMICSEGARMEMSQGLKVAVVGTELN